jgi:flagellar protein FlaF
VGFGVSGSTAIIFLGVLIATGTLYTAAAGTAETLEDAHDSDEERLLDRRNTDINVTSVTYRNNSGSYPVEIRVNNTGTETLSVNDTSILVDNEYRPIGEAKTVTVDGTSGTDIWASGETLFIELFPEDSPPQRVKVVTENGVEALNTTPEEDT